MKREISKQMPIYASENIRFRKAYIRDRLAELKAERETLIAERERIDSQISEAKPVAVNGVGASAR